MIEIPQEWLDMAERVALETGSEVLIAGGAPRDLYLGRLADVADVDLFLFNHTDIEQVREFGFPDTSGECGRAFITGNQWDYDVVLTPFDKPEQVLADFDYGLCAIGYSPSRGRWYASEDFLPCAAGEKLGLRPFASHRSAKHDSKMRAKYPDYDLILPGTDLPFDVKEEPLF